MYFDDIIVVTGKIFFIHQQRPQTAYAFATRFWFFRFSSRFLLDIYGRNQRLISAACIICFEKALACLAILLYSRRQSTPFGICGSISRGHPRSRPTPEFCFLSTLSSFCSACVRFIAGRIRRSLSFVNLEVELCTHDILEVKKKEVLRLCFCLSIRVFSSKFSDVPANDTWRTQERPATARACSYSAC